MPSPIVLIAVVAALLIVAFAVWTLRRRGGERSTAPDLPPPPGGNGRTSKVRVLGTDQNAREARDEALREEIASLGREAEFAENRGLDRRAERLREMIEDRRRQLSSHSPSTPEGPR